MKPPKLILKRPAGWFAAGAEISRAMEILSDGSFKVFVYLCLKADRHTGKLAIRPSSLAGRLRTNEAAVHDCLRELVQNGVCVIREEQVEICDRFWPYHKSPDERPDESHVQFLRRVRTAFLAPACVNSDFTPADEKLAIDLHQRGLSVESINRAISLGCARRYALMLAGKSQTSVTSLAYFATLINEVLQPQIPPSYWDHVRRKAEQLEKRWVADCQGTGQ